MYPYFRAAREFYRNRKAATLDLGETHISQHLCLPGDIDPWMELNNGRTLTLFDLGRVGLFARLTFFELSKSHGWAGTVAGASIRYRRRIRVFDRIEMRSRITGWDNRFFYCEQSLWRQGECASHGLIRIAVVGDKGIVPAPDVAAVLGFDHEAAILPGWISAWADADGQRPWPPMNDG